MLCMWDNVLFTVKYCSTKKYHIYASYSIDIINHKLTSQYVIKSVENNYKNIMHSLARVQFLQAMTAVKLFVSLSFQDGPISHSSSSDDHLNPQGIMELYYFCTRTLLVVSPAPLYRACAYAHSTGNPLHT